MASKQKVILLISVICLLAIGLIFGIIKYGAIFKAENNVLILNSYDPVKDGSNAGKNIAGISESGELPEAIRGRAVDLNPKIIKPDGIANGDIIKLNLFPDADYTAKIDRISKNINNTTTIRGRIENHPQSYILITTTGNKSLVDIEVPEKQQRFIIQDSHLDGNYLFDLGPKVSNELQDHPTLTPPTGSKPAVTNNNAPANGPLDPVTIDVMIVYTTAARVWADTSSSGIDDVIAQAMAKSQLVNDNSNTALTLRLVHSVETNYVESGDSGTDLVRLTDPNDGHMDNVTTLRNQYAADLVTILENVQDVGGISWLLNDINGEPDYAYSLVRVQQTGWTYTLVHELGHNLGNGHSKIQNFQPGPGLFDYSAGWRWIGSDAGKYCSVMTYEAGYYFADGQTHTRVAYWSNPDITYQAVATGSAADGDNARTIREIKAVITAYRDATISPTINIGAPSATSTISGPITYAITYGGASEITLANNNVTLNKTDTADGTVAVTGSGTETRTVTISSITGEGTLGISIAAGTAVNVFNNTAPAAGPSTTFNVGAPKLNLSPANFANGWNMSSFPDLSPGVTSNTLLPGTFKARRYDGLSNSYIKGEDSDITLTPGAGYWIKVDDVNNVTGRNYILNQVSSTEIATTFGWNLLGNPYQSNLPLSNLVVKYNNGSTQSYEDAINAKKVSGYAWSWEKGSNQYLFTAIHPDRYNTDASKQTVIYPFRGFWMIVKSDEVSSIIINR